MRDETIKYCNIDCISLYQVINKFNTLIFNLFEMNIHKYPTLSSLAFAIFRTHFLIENTIPQISGQIAKDIRITDTNAFGFFYCNIIAPENLNEPIIQTHVKTNNGLRTIAPLGK